MKRTPGENGPIDSDTEFASIGASPRGTLTFMLRRIAWSGAVAVLVVVGLFVATKLAG